MYRRNWSVLVLLLLPAVVLGCASAPTKYIQLRMAEPTVLPDETGMLNPPLVTIQEYEPLCGRKRDAALEAGMPPFDFTDRCGPVMPAAIVWNNPAEAYRTRVSLEENKAYHMRLVLPENFEYRRLALLRTKAEGLYQSLEEADQKLRANTASEAALLSPQARAQLIEKCATMKAQIDQAQVDRIQTSGYDPQLDASIQELAGEIARIEGQLRADDLARDRLLTPELVESLANQMEEWRAELTRVKSRIVALELMVSNANRPYPRVINGWIETGDCTTFAASGALPVVVEDEYLDWIREDKVVTIVLYDPNVLPANADQAAIRSALPEYWPSQQLAVVTFETESPTVPRAAIAGTAANTRIVQRVHKNVKSSTYQNDKGYTRTYLEARNGEQMWVFGPDLTPENNVEVWLMDASGNLETKLYPPDSRRNAGHTLMSQIAGVEGGTFDPIAEAEKRGQVVAVLRLGSRMDDGDERQAHRIYSQEIERARNRPSRVR